MITDGKKWHYLDVTNLSPLLQGKSSNHDGDFYNLNCFNSYTTNNLEKSYTVKRAKHEPSAWAMFIKCSFDEKENKLGYCTEKDKTVLKNCVKS